MGLYSFVVFGGHLGTTGLNASCTFHVPKRRGFNWQLGVQFLDKKKVLWAQPRNEQSVSIRPLACDNDHDLT